MPSEKQLELWSYIIEHVEENGYQPSVLEMAEHFGVTNRAICQQLELLIEHGLINGDKSVKARAWKLNGVSFKAVFNGEKILEESAAKK